jgi:hypothetical protein
MARLQLVPGNIRGKAAVSHRPNRGRLDDVPVSFYPAGDPFVVAWGA